MKKLFFTVWLISIAAIAFAQGESQYSEFNIPTKNGAAFYENIDSGFNKSKGLICSAVRKSFSDIFNNANFVIEIDADGQLIGKGYTVFEHKIQLGIKEQTTVKFTVSIDCSNNKFRVQLYDFFTWASGAYHLEPLDRMLKNAKGYRTRFLPAFNIEINRVLLLFVTTIKANLEQPVF